MSDPSEPNSGRSYDRRFYDAQIAQINSALSEIRITAAAENAHLQERVKNCDDQIADLKANLYQQRIYMDAGFNRVEELVLKTKQAVDQTTINIANHIAAEAERNNALLRKANWTLIGAFSSALSLFGIFGVVAYKHALKDLIFFLTH